MKVIEHILNAKHPLISFEIIPPLRGGSAEKILSLVEDISKHNPPFIDITSHSANLELVESKEGVQKITRRKRPGTLGICALIQHKFGIDAIPHVLCKGFSKQETEDFLIDVNYLGIDNVMALRGDDTLKPTNDRPDNKYAIDLVNQINNMNKGIYTDLSIAEPTNFCVGVAGYPECHIESPNLSRDLYWLKNKVEAGADYIVTQMFFNNHHFFNFKDECSKIKLDIPVIPGIKIITSKNQITSLPKTFHCEIPEELVLEIEKANPKHVSDIGVEWAYNQIQGLFDSGIKSVHIYIMQSTSAVNKLMKKLGRTL